MRWDKKVWLPSQVVAATVGIVALFGLNICQAAAQEMPKAPIGRTATADEIAAWNIDIAPDGTGLPAGSGTVAQGKELYAAACADCHGPVGNETRVHSLIVPRLHDYWCCATSVYDYIHRAMPFYQAQSLQPDEVYSLVAFVLFQNKIVPEDFVADAKSLPAVEMPRAPSYAFNPWTTLLSPLPEPGNPWSRDDP